MQGKLILCIFFYQRGEIKPLLPIFMIGELEIYETDSYSSAHVVLIRAIEQKLAFVTQQEVFITNQLMFM